MICGIDPGAKGGFVVLDKTGNIKTMSAMPMIGKEVDCSFVRAVLRHPCIKHIVLEHSQAIPRVGKVGISSAASFSFGKNFGVLIGIIECLGIPYTLVKPKMWQKKLFEGTDPKAKPKIRARLSAHRLFPGEPFLATPKSKVPHEGLVDAALIALHGYRSGYGGK